MESDFQIDEMRLDQEWVAQPALHHKYAIAAADARREFEQVKNELEVAKAVVDTAIRSDPNKYGLSKVTEATVAAAVIQHGKVGAALETVIDKRHEYEVMLAAVSSMDHRKQALENLVKLSLANYFSTPQAQDDGKEIMAEVEKKGVRSRGKRRRQL